MIDDNNNNQIITPNNNTFNNENKIIGAPIKAFKVCSNSAI